MKINIPFANRLKSSRTSHHPEATFQPQIPKVALAILAVLNLYPVAGQGLVEFAAPNPANQYFVYGSSANGTAMVGTSWTYLPSFDVWDPAGLWYWSPSRQFVSLPDGLIPPVDYGWNPTQIALSGDGQVAVGVRHSTGELWRWSTDGSTQFSGEVPYHTSAGYNDDWRIESVSSDGSIVVGRVLWQDADGYESIPFRWNKLGGFSRLNAMPLRN